MSDLTEFLAALDEDEQVARAAAVAGTPDWHRGDDHLEDANVLDGNGHIVVYDEGSPSVAEADHIARHDPKRALAEAESKRRVVALHCVRSGTGGDWDTDPAALCNECGTPFPCETLELLALPYASRGESV